MKLELIEHLRFRIPVGVPEVDSLKIDGALAHHERLRIGSIGNQTRLIENGRHPACIAESAVQALKARVNKVELVRNGLGVC